MSVMEIGSTRRAQAMAIAAEVAAEFGVSLADILGPRRWRRISMARHVAIGVLLRHPTVWGRHPATLPRLGKLLGRDHTTILWARDRYESWCREANLDPADVSSPMKRARVLRTHLGLPELAPPPAPEAPVPAEPPKTPAPKPPSIPVPVPEPSMTALPVSLPPLISGDLFGPIEPGTLEALSPFHRREAMLLLEDRISAEDPKLPAYALHARIGNAFGIEADEVVAILASAPEMQKPAGVGDEDEPRFHAGPTIADAGERTFLVFAQIYLTADAGGGFVVAEAYDQYVAFCRSRLDMPMPRANFGASLRRLGGRREGARIAGLRLRAPVVNAACEAAE